MTSHIQNDASFPTSARRESLAESVALLGAAWARYGISIGRAALETTAHAQHKLAEGLETTAKTLGRIAEELQAKKGS